MARRLSLKRVLKGANRATLEALAEELGAAFRVVDPTERELLSVGEAKEGEPLEAHPIEVDGTVLGVLHGRSAALALLLTRLAEREAETMALAKETLERYKELTLLYDMSDSVSRVLDIGEVARMVVDKAHRFLKASSAALLLLDERQEWLTATAVAGDDSSVGGPQRPDVGIVGRVLESGRAELADEPEAGAVMGAPLRSGERVIGVLRVRHERAGTWTAGDLKLLTALASNAGSAISHATLHGQRLREEALRNQVERDVSLDLLDAARGESAAPGPSAVLFCDLGGMVRALDVAEGDVVQSLSRALSLALNVLLSADATVNLAAREKLVAIFPRADGLATSASAAVRAGAAVVDALMWADDVTAGSSAGVGVASVDLAPSADPSAFLSAVGHAAALSAESLGRVLVTEEIAGALEGTALTARPLVLPHNDKTVREVRV